MGNDLVVFYQGETPTNAESLGARLVPLGQSADYEFAVGTAASKLVYVSHPLEPNKLIPFALYDEFILQDRFNEAVRIVTSLGACEVVSQSVLSDVHEGGGEASVKGVGLRGSGRGEQHTRVDYSQRGKGGKAIDPAPLRWPDAPGFEAARMAVLNNGCHEVEIRVTSDQVFSVESDLAAALKKAGLTLGASYRKSRTVSYLLRARFPGWEPDGEPLASTETVMDDTAPETVLPKPKKKSWFSS